MNNTIIILWVLGESVLRTLFLVIKSKRRKISHKSKACFKNAVFQFLILLKRRHFGLNNKDLHVEK